MTDTTRIALENMAIYLWATLGLMQKLLNDKHDWLKRSAATHDLMTIGLMFAIVNDGVALAAELDGRHGNVK